MIATKVVIPPRRAQMVVRQRLVELLEQAASRPLTLVSAPAGFGKTTLITSWIYETARQSRVAWLSLDEDDSDLVRFVYYLIATLQSVEPRVARAPIALLGSLKMPGPRDLMTLLLNELVDARERIVLVLDDYHAVHNPDIDTALAFLIDHMPQQLRVIIATREEPSLPLGRWRSKELLVEIGLEDLRFSYEEAVLFFRQTMGLNIDSSAARTLETRTEGWIAALQLAALSLRHRRRDESLTETANTVAGFGGRHRYLVDYLAAEVLKRQPDDTRAFLQRTAILQRMCAPLCDELSGRSDGDAMLARLEQGNMFLVRLDEERRWYRYHQLFADYLRSALTPADERELHQKASAWFEANGLGAEAIKHALAAHDMERLIRLVRAQVESTLALGEMPTVLAWLREIPDSVLRTHSDLAGYKAWLLYVSGEAAEAATYSRRAPGAAEDSRPGEPPGQLTVLFALKSFLALNWSDPEEAIPLARQALDHMRDDTSFFYAYTLCLLGQAQSLTNDRRGAISTLRDVVDRARRLGNHLMTADAIGHLAIVLRAQGALREAVLMCQNAIEEHVDAGGTLAAIAGLVSVPLGILYYESDDLESARTQLTTGINLCQQLGMAHFKLVGQCALARLQHVRGEHDNAWSALTSARELAGRPESPRRYRLLAAATAELQLREGNVEGAARTLEGTRKLVGQASEAEALAHARVLLAQHNPSLAWKTLSALEEFAIAQHSEGSLVSIHLLQALCKRSLGQQTGALERMERAVSLGASTGFRRAFVDELANVAALLEQVRHIAPAFVNSLLDPRSAEDQLPAAGPLPEPLTRIEIEILGLLNHGMTNQEIATKLALTVGTTKWRLNQIFGKLQVRNRIEALARARQLKLL
jgi:LuxR family maltose regulon positive regulatory protein